MAFVGTIIQEVVKIRKNRNEKKIVYSEKLQLDVLIKLLTKAQKTAFGVRYNFPQIINSANTIAAFKENVPVFDYNKMYDEWWYRTVQDEDNVTWPGKIKYFALTSGTSGSPSKRVPISMDMIVSMRQTSIRQMLCMYDLQMPKELYTKQLLMVGGSADLKKIGLHYEGDLSGILATQVPRWFYRFRKPRKKIAAIKDWEEKLQVMTENAHKWDIGIVGGVPAWIQLLFERILEHYKVDNVHEIWPNLQIYVHGGVAFSPYEESIKKYLGRDIKFLDTYLASEGFIAFENAFSKPGMQLVLDKGIYFEFIPFNDQNFVDGEVVDNPEIVTLYEVDDKQDYAVLISTCSGVWRYMIGDTIRFTNTDNFEIIITGRTKHFLSLCGEHLSVDNMNTALERTAKELGFEAYEFTVAGILYENSFAHKWFIGGNSSPDKTVLKNCLDKHLRALNDDYATERNHALKEVFVEVLPVETFYNWMDKNGKVGGQAKFPRVLNKEQLSDWEQFISK
jgi:hypothetical protein